MRNNCSYSPVSIHSRIQHKLHAILNWFDGQGYEGLYLEFSDLLLNKLSFIPCITVELQF